MAIHYATYATHDSGMFKELVNNPYNLDITVLGWGAKWNGYMDKIRAVSEYISKLPRDDIVCVLDGFDTFIQRDPKDVLRIFKRFNAKVVISKDRPIEFIIAKYFARRVFGGDENGNVLNAGMYMGYVSELQKMFKLVLRERTEDDQRAINSVSKYLDIKIDTDFRLFYNSRSEGDKNERSIFVSYPGAVNEKFTGRVKRIYRGFGEYLPYLIPETTAIIMAIVLFVIWLKKR